MNKRTWIRRATFQIHLWSGLILGLYVVVVCASGSAIVFRNDLYDWLEAGGRAFAGKALLYRSMSWLGKLHGSLLAGSTGMTVNAVCGFLTALLCVSGLLVWWPSSGSWRRSLTIQTRVGWKRMNFDTHRAVGFWTFALLFMWGVTGGYFVFPDPFRAVIGYFTPLYPVGPQFVHGKRVYTLGGRILRGFSYAHYGNFSGWGVKTLWLILGLAPVVLFATALLMWWNRVLRPAMLRSRRVAERSRAGEQVGETVGRQVG